MSHPASQLCMCICCKNCSIILHNERGQEGHGIYINDFSEGSLIQSNLIILWQKWNSVGMVIWVLQPIVYSGSCLIQTDSGKGLYNMWTASSRCNTELVWKFKVNSIKGLSFLWDFTVDYLYFFLQGSRNTWMFLLTELEGMIQDFW